MKKTIFFKICKRCNEMYRTRFRYSRTCIKCNKRDTVLKKIERI